MKKSARAQALTEFALVLPIFLVIILMLFDFGRAVYSYNTLGNSTRAAVRVFVVDQNATAVEAKAREQSIALDMTQTTVVVTDPTAAAGCNPVKIGCPAHVEMTHLFTPLTPIVGSLIGPVSLTAASEMSIERVYTSP